MGRTGFPWVEVATDGSSVVGKHSDTGGEVSIGTVTSQLLYEIGGPRYLGPDVTTRFDTIQLEQIGRDRVRISGVRGEPPPTTLKVAINETGGYRNDMAIGLTGLNIEAKARLLEEAFWVACPFKPEDFASVTTRLIRTDKLDPSSNEEAVAAWSITVQDHDQKKVGRAVSNVIPELGLGTIPGFFRIGGAPSDAKAFGVYHPAQILAQSVPAHVTVLGEGVTIVASEPARAPEEIEVHFDLIAYPDGNDTVRVPIGEVVGARSGDKGGNANLGVFARTDEAWIWLENFLSVEKLRELLPESAPLTIDRFRFPNIRSLNFVLHGLLQDGVASSTRQDPQAKGLGEWLRSRVVDMPRAIAENATVRNVSPSGWLQESLASDPDPRPGENAGLSERKGRP